MDKICEDRYLDCSTKTIPTGLLSSHCKLTLTFPCGGIVQRQLNLPSLPVPTSPSSPSHCTVTVSLTFSDEVPDNLIGLNWYPLALSNMLVFSEGLRSIFGGGGKVSGGLINLTLICEVSEIGTRSRIFRFSMGIDFVFRIITCLEYAVVVVLLISPDEEVFLLSGT